MKKNPFPVIALALGIVLSILTVFGTEPMENGHTRLPILMLLLANEFGFFVTLIGGVFGFIQLRQRSGDYTLMAVATGCLLLAVAFVYLGLTMWLSL